MTNSQEKKTKISVKFGSKNILMKVLFIRKTMKTALRALCDCNSTMLVFQHSFQTFALLICCTVSQHTENRLWNLLFGSVTVYLPKQLFVYSCAKVLTRLLRTTLTYHHLRKAKRSESAFFKLNT